MGLCTCGVMSTEVHVVRPQAAKEGEKREEKRSGRSESDSAQASLITSQLALARMFTLHTDGESAAAADIGADVDPADDASCNSFTLTSLLQVFTL